MLTKSRNKYNAKIVYWDTITNSVISKDKADSLREGERSRLPSYIVRFDSTLEFEVYLKLLFLYGSDRVHRQVPVELIPKGTCYSTGKPWKVDFGIINPFNNSYRFYVEAKGRITADFRNTLPILEHTNPEVFKRLILVFGSKVPVRNRVIASLIKSSNYPRIYTLKKFNQLTTEP